MEQALHVTPEQAAALQEKVRDLGWPGGQRPAPHVPGAWPAGDDGAPDGAVRCVDCGGGLEHLGRGLEHLERTGHAGVTFVGGSDRVWSPVPTAAPLGEQLRQLRGEH